MKFKPPAFVDGIESPVEGEVAFRDNFPGKIIVGSDELEKEEITIKNMFTGESEYIKLKDIKNYKFI